jgi:hypothetical protein
MMLQVPEFYNFPPFFTLQPVLETRYLQFFCYTARRILTIATALAMLLSTQLKFLCKHANAGLLLLCLRLSEKSSSSFGAMLY